MRARTPRPPSKRTAGGRRTVLRLEIALILAGLLTPGCAAAPDHPFAEPGVAPALEPPPPRRPLGWQEALAAARRGPPAAAIAELDRHPFSFPLDRSTLALLRAAGLAPPVVDYLTKRARVDWGALRGDVDPETPAARPQVSGRAGG